MWRVLCILGCVCVRILCGMYIRVCVRVLSGVYIRVCILGCVWCILGCVCYVDIRVCVLCVLCILGCVCYVCCVY